MTDEDVIVLIPIRTVVYPGMVLVQETKNADLIPAIKDCHDRERSLGLVLNLGGELCAIGCLVRVVEVTDLSDDQVQVAFRGEVRFSIVEKIDGAAPLKVRMTPYGDLDAAPRQEEIMKLQDDLMARYKEIILVLKPEKFTQIVDLEGQSGMAYPLAATTVFDLKAKQQVLEEQDELGRLRLIRGYYEKILPDIKALGGNGATKPDNI